MAVRDAKGDIKSLEEGFDWQLDHGVDPPRWVGGIAGLRAGAYAAITSTLTGAKEGLDVHTEGGYLDDWTFQVANDKGLAVGGVCTNDLVDGNDFGVFKINTKRELFVIDENSRALIQTEDVPHATADKGIMPLFVRNDEVGSLVDTDGDYGAGQINEHGILRTQAQQHLHISEMNDLTGWSVLGDDTINLATTTNHVFDTLALEFDKVNGTDDTVFAGIQKTITSIDIAPYGKGGGFFLMSVYLSNLANVDYIFLRLGIDNANYNEWRIENTDVLSVGWNSLRMPIFTPNAIVGNGWNSAAVTYVAVGVAFNAETDTLADIAFDHLAVNTGLQTSADITAQVSSSVSSPNVVVRTWGNAVDTNTGNAGNNTLRVVTATDDPNISALAGTVAGTELQVDVVAALPTGANAIGKLAVNDGIDIGDVTVNNPSGSAVYIQPGAGIEFTVNTVNFDIRDLAYTQDDISVYGSQSQPLQQKATSYELETTIENQLVSEKHDYIGLGYTGDNLTTVTYKTGGAGGATVALLTLAYTGSTLDSVTKT